MAGISQKSVKSRIKSMESTRQITKAMEMVAASKLRKAQSAVAGVRPYFEMLQAIVRQIADTSREMASPYYSDRELNRGLYIVIAGDRGLAGGYNSNVCKYALSQMKGGAVLPIGKKTVDFFRSKGTPMESLEYANGETVTMQDCRRLARQVCQVYLQGRFDSVFLVYTAFDSALIQKPAAVQLLPLRWAENRKIAGNVLYEPDVETVLDRIVPQYLGGIFYGGLWESRASEQIARRTAMDSASKNAEEMIDDLRLQYNHIRQGAITQEITEIVAGN